MPTARGYALLTDGNTSKSLYIDLEFTQKQFDTLFGTDTVEKLTLNDIFLPGLGA